MKCSYLFSFLHLLYIIVMRVYPQYLEASEIPKVLIESLSPGSYSIPFWIKVLNIYCAKEDMHASYKSSFCPGG